MPAQYEVMRHLGSAIKIKIFAPALSKRARVTSGVCAFEKFAWFLGLCPSGRGKGHKIKKVFVRGCLLAHKLFG